MNENHFYKLAVVLVLTEPTFGGSIKRGAQPYERVKTSEVFS